MGPTVLGLVAVLALAVVVIWLALYRWDGGRGSGEVVPTEARGWDDFIVRLYAGGEQRDALAGYARDAEVLVGQGYLPVGQSWGDGQWSPILFVLALVLSLFGIGLILLAYMAIMRPGGTLCVTYRRQAP